jgi:hypothetical protein
VPAFLRPNKRVLAKKNNTRLLGLRKAGKSVLTPNKGIVKAGIKRRVRTRINAKIIRAPSPTREEIERFNLKSDYFKKFLNRVKSGTWRANLDKKI